MSAKNDVMQKPDNISQQIYTNKSSDTTKNTTVNKPSNTSFSQTKLLLETRNLITDKSANEHIHNQKVVGVLKLLQQYIHENRIAGYPYKSIITEFGKLLEDVQDKYYPSDSNIIAVVGMVFNTIYDTADISDDVKNLITYLEAPILKTAFIDIISFDRKTHPARMLLDQLIETALRLNKSTTDAEKLHDITVHIVDRILADFDEDNDIFSEALKELEIFSGSFVGNQDTNPASAPRLVDVDRIVAMEIAYRINNYKPTKEVREFITNTWEHVLLLTYVHSGYKSKKWDSMLKIADNLIWCAKPKKTNKEQDQAIDIIPKIIKCIKEELARIDYPAQEQNKLFKKLFALHFEYLEKQNKGSELNDIVISKTLKKNADFDSKQAFSRNTGISDDDLVDSDNKLNLKWNDEYAREVKQLRIGTKVELINNGKLIRAKLAWKSEFTDDYVFVDSKYKVVAEKTFKELACDFYQGNIKLTKDSSLVNTILNPIIDRLRNIG